jgi:glycosyltransferase involved in cell wall biosynthesis
VRNYIANLLAALAAADHDLTYIAFVTEWSHELVPSAPNFHCRPVNLDSRHRVARVLYENTILQRMVAREAVDCLHWFSNADGIFNAAPAVVSVYDLLPFLDLAGHSLIKRAFLRWRMRAAARRAAWLLPMSQATADTLRVMLRADLRRCTVIPAVVEDRFKPVAPEEAARFRSTHALPQGFWLYVANLYPHKNHVGLLRAYRKLKDEGVGVWPLVLRGDPGGAEEQVNASLNELGLRDDVRFLGRLDREDLPLLYGCASALVFPSLHEGGGIPLIEAMACGCPVVASNLLVVHEAAGDGAVYFDPSDVGSIAAAMRRFEQSPPLRERCRSSGLQRVRAHRGAVVAPALVAAYRNAVEWSRVKGTATEET